MATRKAREGSKATPSQTSAITKRNGAGQTLPESEDRYHALFDRSLDAVYIHDFEGNFLDANDAALRLLGYSRDEIPGLSFANLLDASQLPTALAVLQEIMKNGSQAQPTMFKLKRKDGSLVEVETVAALIKNGGQPLAIQGIARDITERRQMEERPQEAKAVTRMVNLPRLRIPLPSLPGLPLLSSVKGRMIAGFGLLLIILIAVVSGSAWLARDHRSQLAEMEATVATENLLEDAAFNTTLANLLLDRYLISGNDQAVPIIRSSLATVEDSLAEALSMEEVRGDQGVTGVDDQEEFERLHELVAAAAATSDTFEQVIALRRSGDQEGARQVLEDTVAEITAFELLVTEAADEERAEIPALQSQADRTAGLAFWLLVLSGAGGATLGLAASVFIARSILRPLSSVESVALAVAGGNLEARAQPSGPKELASLGASLNRMTESLLETNRASLEEKVRELETEVTERKQAEEALRESEERFRTLYTKTPAMVHSIGTDGNIVTVSDRWLEVLGYERNEVIGRKSTEFLTAESRQYAETVNLPKFWKTGRARDVAYQFVRKNGEIVDVLVSAVVERDREGNILRTLAVLDDVTTRKQAEEALRGSEAKYRAIFENVHDVFYETDENAIITEISPSVTRYGYTREELIGTSVLGIYEDPEERTSIVNALIEGGEIADYELRFKASDGRVIDASINARLLRSPDGSIAGSEGALRDITERKQVEEALRESEQKFRLLAENSTEAIWLLDPQDYHVLYVNPAYEKLWGHTCQSLYDEPRSWLSNIHPEDLERVLAALDIQAETGTFNEEFRIIRPDGSTRWVWDRGFAVRDESGQPYRVVGLAADITERKRREEELQQSRGELEGRVEQQMLEKNVYGLTFREFTVLHLVSAGKADKEIAHELGISPLTVHKHVANILGKMNAGSRTEAAARALREGLLD